MVWVTEDPMQRASDGWWEKNHPTDLCQRLCVSHCELVGLWWANEEAEEIRLHVHFNEGVLKHRNCHNDFYDESERPTIYRELLTWFAPLTTNPFANYPPPSREKTRKE